jgi:hypothetical protein
MRAFSKLQLFWHGCAAALLLCLAGGLQAQTTDADADPPSRVARLSWLGGDVGLLPSGAQDWGEAGINRPLTTGDRLSSSAGARAELELDGAALRMDGQTDVGFLQLDDQLAQLELTQGTLNLTVRRLGDGQSYEIDTPTVALVVDQPGSFRVDVDRDGQGTRVTAFDGTATVYGENDAQRKVIAGRSYRFADSALADVELQDIAGGDDFDAWNAERDRRYAESPSRQYVSEEVIGYQDLDRYGQWRSDPEYGQVWYPAHVDADWAPYRNGHWAWVGPWGWTWVDDAPWGFAPYHYGRWAWRSHGWGWVPGPIGWRPVYAPALVAFIGGRHWSVSVGDRPVGWFPLGPGEVYDPWYRSSRRYYTQVNVTNIHVHNNRTVIVNRIDRRYRDWHRGIAPPVRALDRNDRRGFTAVSGRAFADADRVQRHRLHVDPRKLGEATVLTRAAAPKPTPRSLAPQRPPHARALPTQGLRREVVARHEPRAQAPALAARARTQAPVAAAPGHVRVLRASGERLPAVARVVPADRVRPAQNTPRASVRAPAEVVRRADTAVRAAPDRTALRRDDAAPRRDELRSARFAHPRGVPDVSREPVRPRPGVSFISSPQADRERAAQAAPRLPQVPRLQRAEAPRGSLQRGPDSVATPRFQRAPAPDAAARAARIEAARGVQAAPRAMAPREVVQAPREAMRPRDNGVRTAPPAFRREPAFRAPPSAAPRLERAPAARPMRAAAPTPAAAPAAQPAPRRARAPARERSEGGHRGEAQQ